MVIGGVQLLIKPKLCPNSIPPDNQDTQSFDGWWRQYMRCRYPYVARQAGESYKYDTE